MDYPIIIQTVIILIGFGLAVLKNHFNEMSKSKIIKNDIETLTNKVESVKNVYIKEQEVLRTEFQRILTNEVEYRNEERKFLIEYHGNINSWFYSILAVNFYSFDRNNYETLIESRNRITSFYSTTGVSKSKVMLLIEDSELTKLTDNLFTEILNFHNWADLKYLELQSNLERQKRVIDLYFSLKKDKVLSDDPLMEDTVREESELKSKRDELLSNYLDNRNEKCQPIYLLLNQFENLTKKYLKK